MDINKSPDDFNSRKYKIGIIRGMNTMLRNIIIIMNTYQTLAICQAPRALNILMVVILATIL